MYIDKFKLQNFQIHKEYEEELSSGINVIIGPSDNGKSTLYRALKALFLNNVNLQRKLTHNAKKPCKIEAEGEFGSLARIRGKSTNEYIINGKKLKAFGQGLVEDVVKETNISEINFQSQHDQPFLVSANGGEVARYLNKIINLEVIDRTLSNLKALESKKTTDVKHYELNEKEKLEELKSFEGIEELSEALSRIEELQQQADDTESVTKLEELIDKLGDALDNLDLIEDMKSSDINIIKSLYNEILIFEEKEEELEDLSESLLRFLETDFLKDLDASALIKICDSLTKIEEDEEGLVDLMKQLANIDLSYVDFEIDELKHELHEISPTCPTCGGNWK